MIPTPAYRDEHAALSATAIKLRERRAAGDPALVTAGKLTQSQADDRARIADALAAQWHAIIRRRPIPDLAATQAEILDDLTAIAAGAAAFATRQPNSRDTLDALREETATDWRIRHIGWPESDLPPARAPITAETFAQLAAALLWHQQPTRPHSTTARIVFVHGLNLELWARAAAQRSKAA